MKTLISISMLLLVASQAVTPAVLAGGKSEEEDFIRPGRGFHTSPKDGEAMDTYTQPSCTIGAIVQNGSGYWAISAGHCDHAGQANDSGKNFLVWHSLHGTWGEFVWSRWDDPNGTLVHSDIGLIRIYEEFQDNVNATITAWGGPNGVVPSASLAPGTPLGHTGFPYPANDITTAVPVRREAVVVSHNATMWVCTCVGNTGDSGGPVIEKASGKLLGVFSSYTQELGPLDPAGKVGVNFDVDFELLKQNGYGDLQLVHGKTTPT